MKQHNQLFDLFFMYLLAYCSHNILIGKTIDDFSELNETNISQIFYPTSIEDFEKIIQSAKSKSKKISIAGKRHSQGGHTFCNDAMVVDITKYNKVLNLDLKNKTIRVQTGITWEQIQEYIHPHNLAVKVMQTTQIFTVGGSLSVNAHGRDPNYGPLIETIRSIKIVLASGQIVTASRASNYELFKLAIGGYGLFGIILEAEIKLTDNVLYKKNSSVINVKEYAQYIRNQILPDKSIGLHSGILCFTGYDAFKKLVVINYKKTQEKFPRAFELDKEKFIFFHQAGFNLRKNWSWFNECAQFFEWPLLLIESKIPRITCRNNVMRHPAKFLEKSSKNESNTALLQSYFIPMDKFTHFMEFLKACSNKKNPKIFYALTRYIPKNRDSFLAYSTNNFFEIVLFINQGKSKEEIKETELWTQKIVERVLSYGGNYYLPVQLYPSSKQLTQAYPQMHQFFAKKKQFDPQELFMNRFYEKYAPSHSN